jgi:predicted KAP-like P-loop ATPase
MLAVFFSILTKFASRKDCMMWKFIAVLALAAASFGLGFYFGQRPVGTLPQTVSDLQHSLKDTSRNIIDTTMGIERDLRRRQGLIESKSRVVQAKSELFDKNLGEAAKQLSEAAETLDNVTKGTKQDETILALRALTGTIREVRLELSMGKPVSIKKLDDIQREIDRQLNK